MIAKNHHNQRSSIRVLASLLLLGWLIACAPPVEPPPTVAPQPTAAPSAEAHIAPTAESQSTAAPQPSVEPQPTAAPDEHMQAWQTVYQRETPSTGDVVDLRAVGDVMLGRYVGQAVERRGFDYPFEAFGSTLQGDLVVGNLESPLTTRDIARPGPYRLPADPIFAAALHKAGFTALSLANNHALDAGPEGLAEASAALQGVGIVPLGVGPDASSAATAQIIERNGIRIALLAFNAAPDPEDDPDEASGWGRAWLNDQALAAVADARANADVVVVLPHWGREYAPQPDAKQREWASKLVAAGADVVIGAHPHVLQPIEWIETEQRSGLVAYSLGNTIFDQPQREETSTGAVLRVLLDVQGVAVAMVAPLEIVSGQARPLTLGSAQGQTALRALGAAPPDDAWPQGWQWNDGFGTFYNVPSDTPLPLPPRHVAVDLRGNGVPVWATLDERGWLELRDGEANDAPLLWESEALNWQIRRIEPGDPNWDGRYELLMLLWKPDDMGKLRSHPFLLGWRGGHYRIIWGGSATSVAIQDLALGDLDGDGREELVVLEGGDEPGAPAETVAVWDWHGWGFELEWRSEPLQPAGRNTRLLLRDLDGDGRSEIIVALAD